jgi:transcriptional regulator with XRE-family HTH domain
VRAAINQVLLAAVLRAFRERSGLSQERLAQRANIDRTYVGSVERGQRNPTMMVVDRLLTEMEVTWAEFGAALDREARRR